MLVVALSACSLPKGKLAPPNQKTDAGSSTRVTKDSGVDTGSASNETASRADSVATPDAATSDAAVKAAEMPDAGGMSAPSKSAAGQKAPAQMPKPKPKPNGELCRGNEDCAEGNCKTGDNGERRCYGALQVDQTCSEPYDCDGFSCVPITNKGKTSVCVDKHSCPMQGTCFEDFGIAMCQLDQHCDVEPGSFSQCYKRACTLAGSSNAQCLAALPAKQSLNESACCPVGGVFKGDCGIAPQCGCGDSMKCDIDGLTGKPVCLSVGSVPPGGSCPRPENCPKGYGCIGNVCKQFCGGSDDHACPADGECHEVNFKGVATGAYFCTHTCDPFAPTSTEQPFLGCGAGQRCNPTPNGHTDCGASGTIPVNSSCDDGTGHVILNGCEPSSVCLNPPKLVCAAFCRVGQDSCKIGTCRSFGTPGYFVFETEVGFCDPP